MGNFEKLSVLVIVVIIVMILVVALTTWGNKPNDEEGKPSLHAVADDGGGGFTDPWTDPSRAKALTKLPAAVPSNIAGQALPGGDGFDPEAFDPDEFDPIIKMPGDDPAETPVAATPAAPEWYVIKAGDTLGHIAARTMGSSRPSYVAMIMAINPGLDPSALRVGQKIRIPQGVTATSSTRGGATEPTRKPTASPGGAAKPGGTYTTRAGDTFERISKRVYGSIERWPAIWVANLAKVPDSDGLKAGTTLVLPK